MRSVRRRNPAVRFGLSPLLAVLLAWPPGVSAQQPAAPEQAKPPAPLPTAQNLRIIVLAGKGGLNDLEHKVMSPLVVQILDQNDRPVDGAEVVFRFPLKGPSATFPNQEGSRTFRSNGEGEAAAVGWAANGQTGNFDVHVTATYGNQSGEATIPMSNVTRIVETSGGKQRVSRSWWSSIWFKIGVAAGGAALVAVIVLATRGSSSKASQPTVTISQGPPTIGGPQ
jgi:hypothetical protein